MKLKKAFSIFLVLTMLLGTFAINTVSAETTYTWADSTVGYSAEKATPDAEKQAKVDKATNLEGVTSLTANTDYKITNVAGLQNFAALVNGGEKFSGYTIYLANDIDNSKVEFSMDPIGKYTETRTTYSESDPGWIDDRGFQGVFDGCGKTIDYLTIESNGDGQAIALFGSIMKAEIRNLILGEHCTFINRGETGRERTAALVAIAQEHQNLTFELTLTDVNGNTEEGSNIIENVKSYATVISEAGYTGGIVGLYIARGTLCPALLRYLTVSGDTTLEGSGYVGGIMGAFLTNAARPLYIYNCQLNGRLIGATTNAICNKPVNGTLNSSGHSVLFLETLSPDYDATAKGYTFDNVGDRVTTGTNINDTDTFNTTTNYIINDAAGLKKLATLSANNYFDSVKFYLTADIDMKDQEMTTIGSDSKQFVGRFDGQGYVIDNLKITVTDGYAGLFGRLEKAVIKNVVLGDGCVFTGKYAGSIVASVRCPSNGLTEIQNCYSEATVVGTEVAGGIVGHVISNGSDAYGCQLRNLTFAGKVTATVGNAGGILGGADRPVLVAYCRNAGEVTGTGNVGALIGSVSKQNKVVYNRSNEMPENGRLIGERGNSVAPYHDNVIITDGTDNSWDLIHFVGYQTKTEGDKVTAIRLLAVVNDLDAEIGFTLSASGGTKSYTYTASKVYSSVLANEDGVDVSVQAQTMGGKYLVAVTIAGIPADGTTLTVTPFERTYNAEPKTISLNVA